MKALALAIYYCKNRLKNCTNIGWWSIYNIYNCYKDGKFYVDHNGSLRTITWKDDDDDDDNCNKYV